MDGNLYTITKDLIVGDSGSGNTSGGSGSNDEPVQQNQAPTAKISTNDLLSGIAPYQIQLNSNLSSDDNAITEYRWEVEGQYKYGSQLIHTFENAGNYPVTLTTTDAEGLSSSDDIVISVSPVSNLAPSADISSSPLSAFTDENVTFYAVSVTDENKETLQYNWQIDGIEFTESNPSYVFSEQGEYTVTLTVTDEFGLNSQQSSTNFSVVEKTDSNNRPIANIVITEGDNAFVFDASDSSDDKAVISYKWLINNDIASETINFTKVIEQPGIYEIALEISDEEGLIGIAKTDLTVLAPNLAPIADFTYTNPNDNNQFYLDSELSFNASISEDDRAISSYKWFFNGNEISSMITDVVTLSDLGDYVLKLIVTDSDGLTDEKEVTINVIEEPIINSAPVAIIEESGPIRVETNEAFTLNSASTDDQNMISSWLWLGDGLDNINTEHATIQFSETGTYQVTLTVTDTLGLTNTSDPISIIVSEPVVPNQAPIANASSDTNNIVGFGIINF